MNYTLNDFIKNRPLATLRVNEWIGVYTKSELCKIFGFSRPTFDRRLKENDWKINELKIIVKNIPF